MSALPGERGAPHAGDDRRGDARSHRRGLRVARGMATPTTHTAASGAARRMAPLAMVAAAVAYGLVALRGERISVAYLNDGSLHNQMVRYAVDQLRAGHLPLDGWFPYLGLGSPLFLHYQSLGEMLTAIVGLGVGANTAYSWSLYLLLSFWPLSVYAAARVLGWDRYAAGSASLLSPFLVSVPGIGYEQSAYVFLGFGVYDQLWGMVLLPLAWACSWRAVARGRHRDIVWAVVLVAATTCAHYFTGYLAFLPLVVWPFLRPSRLVVRIKRSLLVGVGALLASAWVIVPLFTERRWTSINEFLQGTPDVNSYGARQVLGWLFTGQLFDWGRLPIVTVLAGVGLLACAARWRSLERARVLATLFVVFLLCYFGRTTFGPLFDLLPGSADLFLRRFEMAVQLAGLLLAGVGAVALFRLLAWLVRSIAPPLFDDDNERFGTVMTVVRTVTATAVVVLVLAPAWTQLASYDSADAAAESAQATQDAALGAQLQVLVTTMNTLGGGRVYAGLPVNWGSSFLIGDVPVFKYLERLDVQEVGYTLRTASLMTNPEGYFEESNPADYQIFGVRYLILPTGKPPPVPAALLQVSGLFALWEVKDAGYFQVVDTIAPISANKTNLGARSYAFLHSPLASEGRYPTVVYDGLPAAPATAGAVVQSTPPGAVLSSRQDLVDGEASATVHANRPAVVLLSASYDPGWTATVDGTPASTEMIAPALVGVEVAPGAHQVVFRYVGFRYYPELLALAIATVAALGWWRRLAVLLSRAFAVAARH